jgi:hypothetical protein
MNRYRIAFAHASLAVGLISAPLLHGQHATPTPKTIAETGCTAEKRGSAIPAGSIGEPVCWWAGRSCKLLRLLTELNRGPLFFACVSVPGRYRSRHRQGADTQPFMTSCLDRCWAFQEDLSQ